MDDLHQQWMQFICSQDHFGRYLHAGGNVGFEEIPGPALERISEFVSRLPGETDARLLASIYHLAQPRVYRFFFESVPILLRSASHTSNSSLQLSRRGIKGKIAWPETIRARLSGRADAGAFVVRQTSKTTDTPENRLLKLYSTQVVATIRGLESRVGSGAMLSEFRALHHQALLALNSSYLSAIKTELAASALMRQRARRHRNWRYGELAILQYQLQEISTSGKWDAILRLLQQGWLAPVDSDDLFELYTLILVLEVLRTEAAFGDAVRIALIRPGRKDIAQFRRATDGVTAEVFFDQSPRVSVGCPSEYTATLDDYDGVTGSAHRPDVLIRFRFPDGSPRFLVIESKETVDDRYKRDSIYKGYGYLHDFRQLWSDAAQQSPKIVIAFPGGIGLRPGIQEGNRDLVLWSTTDRMRMAELVSRALELPAPV